MPCPDNCKRCKSNNYCLNCNTNYLLHLNLCVLNQCPPGYYKDINSTSCNKCVETCEECTDYNKCTKCTP